MSVNLRSFRVKEDKLHLFYVIKDVGGRMAKHGRIFK
jgi:hypothetical protein